MTRVVQVPFRRAKAERVQPDAWQSHVGAAGPLGRELPHWDYNVDLRLVRSLIVREAQLRQDCRLSPADSVCAVVVWRSTGSTVRGRGAVVPLGNSETPREFSLSADISGQLLATDVVISTQIVLVAASALSDTLAAKYPGSILWEDLAEVALEGTDSRFPMQVVDFSTAVWAPYGGAGWYLAWRNDELHEPLLRNVQLFINSGHPAVAAAVQAAQPSLDQKAIRSAIYFDIGRQLIRGALLNDDFVESPDSYAEGSTGRAILRMVRQFFGGERLRAVRDRMQSRPEYFDSALQASLRLFAPEP